MDISEASDYTIEEKLKFIIPALLGFIIFLIPIKYNGNWTIIIGVIMNSFEAAIKPVLNIVVLLLFLSSFTISLVTRIFKPKYIMTNAFLKAIFDVGNYSLLAKFTAIVFTGLILLQRGPLFVIGDYTGGMALRLVGTLISAFFICGIFFPLLLDFGVMEFMGVFLRGIMRPVFNFPGRSAINCMSSFVGSGTIGIVMTDLQYKEGYYTQKEACSIATCFSVISLPFCLIFSKTIGLSHMFIQIYVTIILACLIAAVILPKIPPLSRKSDSYHKDAGKQINENIPENTSKFKWAMQLGIEKSRENIYFKEVAKKGLKGVMGVLFDLMPIVMVVATAALAVSEFTPVFIILSKPIVGILETIGIPESVKAAPALITGFIDVFIPVIIGTTIESEFTRFIVVCIASTQIIFMSESGLAIMKSDMGIGFMELLILFILRTIITLPVVLIAAKLIF